MYGNKFTISHPSGKALGYKPEGRWFETQWGEILNLPHPSGRTRPWGLLNLLTEINTGNIKEK
jgi:hypothetical protein